jgi:hypothetical protein
LLACYTRKNLLQTLCRFCAHAFACASRGPREYRLSCRVSRCNSAALM